MAHLPPLGTQQPSCTNSKQLKEGNGKEKGKEGKEVMEEKALTGEVEAKSNCRKNNHAGGLCSRCLRHACMTLTRLSVDAFGPSLVQNYPNTPITSMHASAPD
jgi:hypothetical protein